MTIFLAIAALLGWMIVFILLSVLGIISQIYISQKQTILTLLENNTELQKKVPSNEWRDWFPPSPFN